MPKTMMRKRRAPQVTLRDFVRHGASWHPTNALDDYAKRRDVCFDLLTRLYYEDSRRFASLRRRLSALAKRSGAPEWALACAGHLAYIAREYDAACRWLLKAVRANPANLDNWMDLAFALRHNGETPTSNGILFHFDYVMHYARTFGLPAAGLGGLKILVARVVRAREKEER